MGFTVPIQRGPYRKATVYRIPIKVGGWVKRAACRNRRPELFELMPGHVDPFMDAYLGTIHTYCRACPVRAECIDDAIESHDFGVIRGTVMPEPMQWWTCNQCGVRFIRPRRRLGHATARTICWLCGPYLPSSQPYADLQRDMAALNAAPTAG